MRARLHSYIAYRDRDEKREGTEPRKLFSAKEDDLSFWKANQVLTGEREPKKEELMHFAISFRKEDFEALGHDEAGRQQSLKETSREAISQFADEIKADDLRWVAGIHRNTEHPHIHLIFYRPYLDRETGRGKRLTRMPEGISIEETREAERAGKYERNSLDEEYESASGSHSETDGRYYEDDATNEGREPEIIAGSSNTAASASDSRLWSRPEGERFIPGVHSEHGQNRVAPAQRSCRPET
jgi:hypothetical protein